MPAQSLTLSFDPMTIEHLGSNMYSRLPNAVAELVANAFDADASDIEVRLTGTGTSQTIAVVDNGHGMSRDDLQEKYLRIGRNRRGLESGEMSESGERRVSGKKGLGKLALFGIGSVVEVRTKRAGATHGTEIALDWQQLRSSNAAYEPVESTFDAPPATHGTTVTIRQLERKTDINGSDLATSLSRLFNYADDQLQVAVLDQHNREHPVDARTRLDSFDAEFEWVIPSSPALPETVRKDLEAYGIDGRIVAARKPLPTQVRGITVYANGRMVNEPEFFGASDSSYAYAYLTGYVQADPLDEIRPDVIATDRRAVNWEVPDSRGVAAALRSMVTAIATDRRRRRDNARRKIATDRTGRDLDAWVETINDPRAANLQEVLSVVTSEDADLSDAAVSKMVTGLEGLAPEYAEMYWALLHPTIQAAIEPFYRSGMYLNAVREGCVALVEHIRKVTGGSEDGLALMNKTFGADANKYLALLSNVDTDSLHEESVRSFEDGHRDLARGVHAAFRNPASHHTDRLLGDLGVYSWRDCIDALSVLSYLCRRVEAAGEPPRTAEDH